MKLLERLILPLMECSFWLFLPYFSPQWKLNYSFNLKTSFFRSFYSSRVNDRALVLTSIVTMSSSATNKVLEVEVSNFICRTYRSSPLTCLANKNDSETSFVSEVTRYAKRLSSSYYVEDFLSLSLLASFFCSLFLDVSYFFTYANIFHFHLMVRVKKCFF